MLGRASLCTIRQQVSPRSEYFGNTLCRKDSFVPTCLLVGLYVVVTDWLWMVGRLFSEYSEWLRSLQAIGNDVHTVDEQSCGTKLSFLPTSISESTHFAGDTLLSVLCRGWTRPSIYDCDQSAYVLACYDAFARSYMENRPHRSMRSVTDSKSACHYSEVKATISLQMSDAKVRG